MAESEEMLALQAELKWLLREEVHAVLEEIQHTLQECSKCFPMPVSDSDSDSNKRDCRPQRILLSSPSGANIPGSLKCVVTLKGDAITEADIGFRHKQGKEHHVFKTNIRSHEIWKIQQVQDAVNFLHESLELASLHGKEYLFRSAQEVELLLDELMKRIKAGQLSLSQPRRRSLQELLSSRNMQIFQPPIPNDVALSFYVHGSKIVLAIYHINTNGKLDVSSRNQMEAVVQWLSEANICFMLALQQCQQLKNKIQQVCEFSDINHQQQVLEQS